VQNGNYTDNYTNTKVITIPGASSLSVTITYQTESLSYDWVCVFQGAHSDYTAQTTGYLKKLGGSTKTKETFTVTGESVTFAFRSDNSQNAFYGYYAVVTGEGIGYTSTTVDKATGLWVKGDIYTGENEPVPLGGTSIAIYNAAGLVKPLYSTTGSVSVNTTSQSYTSSPTIQSRTTTSNRYYGIETDVNGRLFVNVPWVDEGKVTQYNTSNSGNYPLLMAYYNNTTTSNYITSTYRNNKIYADPSTGYVYAKSHATSSADYAEFYEWEDGNPNNEDRRGHFVTFTEGNKIRIANNTDDYILGVVSVSPAVLGNDYDSEWCGKYLTDAFGKVLTEEVFVEEYTNEETGEIIPAHMETIPILNPEYDESQEYVSREKRKEWVPVGTHG
jgi:hypothetical protein